MRRAYFVPPGHTPLGLEGEEIVQVQPAEEMAETMEVMAKNMQAAAGQA